MSYKLIEAAQTRWRAVNVPHLVALVRAGVKFDNGKLVERPDDTTGEEAAETSSSEGMTIARGAFFGHLTKR